MQRSKMTKGEKRLIGVVASSLALILSGALYRYYLDVDPVINIPKSAMPSPNGFDFYVKAGKAHFALLESTPGADAVDPITDMRSHSGLSPRQLMKIYPTAAKEAWIRKNAPVLKLLRQGLNHPYLERPRRSLTASLPFDYFHRELAYLLVVESHAKAERGDWTGASHSALDILQLGHDVQRGASLFGGLGGCAINDIGRTALTDILPHLDAAASRAVAIKIETLESNRVSLAEILQEEKWKRQVYLQERMKEAGWRTYILISKIAPDEMTNSKARARLEWCSKRCIMSNYTRYMDAVIAEVQKPYTQRQIVPIPDDPVNQIMQRSFEMDEDEVARDENGNAVLTLQFALRAFKMRYSVFPQTLHELVPPYLKRIPLDAYGGGQPLHYRKTGNTYLLYSIGPDGKDDDGKPIDDVSRATSSLPSERYIMQPYSKGDYVAGINR